MACKVVSNTLSLFFANSASCTHCPWLAETQRDEIKRRGHTAARRHRRSLGCFPGVSTQTHVSATWLRSVPDLPTTGIASTRGCAYDKITAKKRASDQESRQREPVVNTNRTSFDVLALLTTKVGGRALSKYPANQNLYSQGDPADSVFYIHKGKVKVTVISERGKGSHRRDPRTGRILRRGSNDREAVALGFSHHNDDVRNCAAREGHYGTSPP